MAAEKGRFINRWDVAYCYGIYLTCLLFVGCVTLHVGAWYDHRDIQRLFAYNGTRADAWNSLEGMDNLIPPLWIHSLFLANYASQLLWILYAFSIPCREAEGRQIVRKVVSGGVLVLFIVSTGCILAWLFLWDRGYFNYSVILMFGASLYAYLGLITSMRACAKEYALMRRYLHGDLTAVRMLVHNGLGLQATLCLSIAFYQVCEILTQFDLVKSDIAFVFIASLLAVKIMSFSAEACCCLKLQNYVMTSYMVVMVECVAIIVEWLAKGKSLSEPKSLALVICAAIIIAACFLFALIKLGVTNQRESKLAHGFAPPGPKKTVQSYDNSGYGRFDDLESNQGTDVQDNKTRSSFVADSDFTTMDGAVSETVLQNTNIVHFGGERTMGEEHNANGNNATYHGDGDVLLPPGKKSPKLGFVAYVNEGLDEEEEEAQYRKMKDYLHDDEVDDGVRMSTSDIGDEHVTPDAIEDAYDTTHENGDAHRITERHVEAHVTNDDNADSLDTFPHEDESADKFGDDIDRARVASYVAEDTHTHASFNGEEEQRHLVNEDNSSSLDKHSDTDANMLSRDSEFDDEPNSNGHDIID